MKLTGAVLCLITAMPVCISAQEPVHIAPNAPADRPVALATDSAAVRFLTAIQPWVDTARATYPSARRRFHAGLPPGHSFFVTTRLVDSKGRFEQIFVAVDSIASRKIYGRIWSPVQLVKGFKFRQPIWLWEDELLDWLITRPDGTEEGNYVGKFLDNYHP